MKKSQFIYFFIVFMFFMAFISHIYGIDDMRDLDIGKPQYYHKEVILMGPCKQYGGLYIQIEDAPIPLARPLFFAPKVKPRRLKKISDNLIETALPTTSIFGFLHAANKGE